jgi:hypothetical protein
MGLALVRQFAPASLSVGAQAAAIGSRRDSNHQSHGLGGIMTAKKSPKKSVVTIG